MHFLVYLWFYSNKQACVFPNQTHVLICTYTCMCVFAFWFVAFWYARMKITLMMMMIRISDLNWQHFSLRIHVIFSLALPTRISLSIQLPPPSFSCWRAAGLRSCSPEYLCFQWSMVDGGCLMGLLAAVSRSSWIHGFSHQSNVAGVAIQQTAGSQELLSGSTGSVPNDNVVTPRQQSRALV